MCLYPCQIKLRSVEHTWCPHGLCLGVLFVIVTLLFLGVPETNWEAPVSPAAPRVVDDTAEGEMTVSATTLRLTTTCRQLCNCAVRYCHTLFNPRPAGGPGFSRPDGEKYLKKPSSAPGPRNDTEIIIWPWKVNLKIWVGIKHAWLKYLLTNIIKYLSVDLLRIWYLTSNVGA